MKLTKRRRNRLREIADRPFGTDFHAPSQREDDALLDAGLIIRARCIDGHNTFLIATEAGRQALKEGK